MLQETDMNNLGCGSKAGCLTVAFGAVTKPFDLRAWIDKTAYEIRRARRRHVKSLSGKLEGYRVKSENLAASMLGI